jgi:hypothetical protein
MKNKALVTALFASAFGVAVSSNAGAALLFGYSAFTSNASSEAADLLPVAGFTSTVTKASASSSTNGSSDGLFGASQYSAASGILNGTPGTGGNGYLNLSSTHAGTATSFSLVNNTGSTYQLEFLFFDGMRAVDGGSGTIRARYDIGGGPTLIANSSIFSFSGTSNASTDYVDFGLDISDIFLADGETVSFLFTGSTTDLRLDNIAVTGALYTPPSGIPEPANFAALGGLLISGLVIRSRRRPAKA